MGIPVTTPMAKFRAKIRAQKRAAVPYDASRFQSARDFNTTINRASPMVNCGNRYWKVIVNAKCSRCMANAESITHASGHQWALGAWQKEDVQRARPLRAMDHGVLNIRRRRWSRHEAAIRGFLK